MLPQIPASKMQAAERRSYKEVVRGVTLENLHSKEAEAWTKAKINKSPGQKSNCVLPYVKETGSDWTCHATDKAAHSIAKQSTTTKPGIAEVPTAKPTELPTSLSLPQDIAVKPKKKCILKALNQNEPNKNTRKVTTNEEMYGKNDQIKKQEPGIIPAVPPEHKVHTEGCWHPLTVNQSCSRKMRCQHNPRAGLPPNVQQW